MPELQDKSTQVEMPAAVSMSDAAAVLAKLRAPAAPSAQSAMPNAASDADLQKMAERAVAAAEATQVSAPTEVEATPAPEGAPREEPVEVSPEVEELPPIEPPRSWTKEEKKTFASLPRETQEFLAERERSRELDFNRRQQDATERSKALEAEQEKARQERTKYEEALPVLLQTLQGTYAAEFADVRTQADVQKMAAEDPMRFVRWQAAYQTMASTQQQIVETQQRQQNERLQKRRDFAQREINRLKEVRPELNDAENATKFEARMVKLLENAGFSREELKRAWEEEGWLYDHRVLQLLDDAARAQEIKQARKTIKTKPVPPPQPSGATTGPGANKIEHLVALTNQISNAPRFRDSVQAAADYLSARRRG